MLRIAPLGGLGEIGLNCMAFDSGDDLILVDAGLMFATPAMPGVDRVLPDFSFVEQNARRLRAVLLTHGHEDHIGALPSLLREHPVPVYGMPFTLALAQARLEEAGVTADLREVGPGDRFPLGDAFHAEPFTASHSMPDAVGYLLDTPEGVVVHTGDFKLDPTPPDGRTTDLDRLAAAGERGVLCLLSDSTNSEVHQEVPSEERVRETLQRLFAAAEGRIFVAMFASHLLRFQVVLDVCEGAGRRLVVQGRSMLRNLELARDTGRLRVPPGILTSTDAAASLPRERVCVLTTGAQGEPRAGLAQLAYQQSREPPLEPGDTVILSARVIPGNERGVNALLDQLHRRGARVIHPGIEPAVHVSGHASRPQQQRMLEAVRPKYLVPVHGEERHLRTHLELGRQLGMAQSRLLLAHDGDVLAFEGGVGAYQGTIPHGRVLLDRYGPGEVTWATLDERTRLGELGAIAAAVVLDAGTGRLVSGPHLHGSGLSEHERLLLDRVAAEARAFFAEVSPQLHGDPERARDELVRAVRRAFRQYTAKRPNVMPVVVRL